MKTLNPTFLILAMFSNFLVIRLSGLFLPDQYYFSFSAFLFDTRDLNKPVALMVKLMLPFGLAFALATAILFTRRSRAEHGFAVERFDHLLNQQLPLTLGYGAMFVAVLLAWPNILLWDVLVLAELQPYRLLFLMAYFAYFISVCFFAMAGANASYAAFGRTTGSGIELDDLQGNRFLQPIWQVVSGGLSASLATFLATRVG